MISILLDSSSVNLIVGIADETHLIDGVNYEAWQCQSEKMIPELKNLLEKYNYTFNDVKDVIVANGPGSYTGVRIAVTTAKIIAFSLGVNLYTVSSLRILKDKDNPSICLMDARANRSYFGVFEADKVIIEDCIKTNEEVLEYINNHPSYCICGDCKYLNIQSCENNILEAMTDLRKYINKVEDILSCKPIYMKG